MSASTFDSMYVTNSMAIRKLPDAEIEKHRGEFAILVDGVILSYHKTNREALMKAHALYRQGGYSVQRIEPQPADVGFVDRADYPR